MVQQEAKCGDDACVDVARGSVTMLLADAERAQAESCGGDASDSSRVGLAVGKSAIADETSARTGFVPEIRDGMTDNFFEKGSICKLPIGWKRGLRRLLMRSDREEVGAKKGGCQ